MGQESIAVAVLIGSVRREGISARLAHALARLALPPLFLTNVPIDELPFYDQDEESDPPPVNSAFRDAIRQSDALLVVTAEYNRGVPAVLKNALDVGSRPIGHNVFDGKPAAIVSQSPGALGGVCANHALRPSLMALNVPVLAQPEMYLSRADTFFDVSGELAETAPVELLASFLAAFTDWIAAHKG